MAAKAVPSAAQVVLSSTMLVDALNEHVSSWGEQGRAVIAANHHLAGCAWS